jgi:hypothetical protein
MSVPISTRSLESHTLECLRTMFGDSETWRALVAQPDIEWSDLETLIAAATSDETEALRRIRYGALQNNVAHPDYVPIPRMCLRHPVTGDLRRMSTTGFESTSTVICVVEFPVPEAYQPSYEDALIDFLNKVGGIQYELQGMHGPGYADVARIALSQAGDLDPKQNNGKIWFGGELFIDCRGGK